MDLNYALAQIKYTTIGIVITQNEQRDFTLETQMGKPTSNVCSVLIFAISSYNAAHGSICIFLPWPNDPLRVKVKK
jgi:hypothetical protein